MQPLAFGEGLGLVSGGLVQVPGWLREDVFWAGSGRFRCGFRAGSRGPGVGSGLVTGGSANA